MPTTLPAVPHTLHNHEGDHNDQADADHDGERQQIGQKVLTKVRSDEDIISPVIQIRVPECKSVVVRDQDCRYVP